MSETDKLKQYQLDELLDELRKREAKALMAGPGGGTDKSAAAAAAASPLAAFATDVLSDFVRDQQKVIYGTDDRKDLFEVADAAVQQDAASVVSLFHASDVTDNG